MAGDGLKLLNCTRDCQKSGKEIKCAVLERVRDAKIDGNDGYRENSQLVFDANRRSVESCDFLMHKQANKSTDINASNSIRSGLCVRNKE